jgi:hypothetical protein
MASALQKRGDDGLVSVGAVLFGPPADYGVVIIPQQGVDYRGPAVAVGHGLVALFAHGRVVVGQLI